MQGPGITAYLCEAFFSMDSMPSAISIHVSAAPDGVPKGPVVFAACGVLAGPLPGFKIKEPDLLHLRPT